MDVGNRHKKRQMIALDIKKIKEDLTLPCGCSRRCNSKFNEFDILEQRKRYHKAKKGIHQQLLSLELFKSSIYSDNGKTVHFVHGQLVCKEFWYLTVLHISRATYHRIKYYASSGIHAFTEPLKKGAIGEKGKIAVGFMQLYISLHGDPCPEEDKVILARGIGIKDAYEEYSRTYSSEYIVKLPRFYQLWGEHFPNVSQRKYSNFTKCNICVLTRHLLSQNLTPEREALVKHDRDEHLKRQRIERELYYNRRAQAVMYPNDKASVILDAMDQSKTNLPNFGADTPKGFDPARRLQTHLIGAILHGRRTYFLLDILQWPHDSNLTISCFLYCLSEEFKDQTRPKTLYVQLDNCCRENKNKYFIGMMALLVKWGFFKEITMNFLMVGHTHEDIDARFSRVSQSLKKKPPKTLTALINELSGCLKGDKSPKVEMVSSVYNFKEWLTPVLNDIHDHTFPHSYRFTIDKPGHVALHYKAWSNDDEWLPKQHDNPLEIFKIDHTTGQQYEPTLTPALVEPDFNRKQQLQDIQSNIEKNMAFFSITEAEWWKMFFKNPKDVSSKPVPWFLDTLNCDAENDVPPVVVDPNCSSPQSIYMEKERATPQVYTGKRHKTTTKTPNETEQAISYSHPVDLGYMVAFIEDGEFGIGEVMKVQGDKLLIKLYNGDLNRQWTPCAINVASSNVEVSMRSTKVWANIGDNVTFYCDIKNPEGTENSFTVVWHKLVGRDRQTDMATNKYIDLVYRKTKRYFGDLDVSDETLKHVTFMVKIINVQTNDTGKIGCNIVNTNAVAYEDLHVIAPVANIYMTSKSNGSERVTYQDGGEEEFSGNDLEFSCHVLGAYPQPDVRMYAGDKDITDLFTQTALFQRKGEVEALKAITYDVILTNKKFAPSYEYHQKDLRCVATVPHSNFQAKSTQIKVTLQKYRPMFLCKNEMEVPLNEPDLEIACRVTADPKITITSFVWPYDNDAVNVTVVQNGTHGQYKGTTIDGDSELEMIMTLQIGRVRPQMFRTYYFIAKNSIGETIHKIELKQKGGNITADVPPRRFSLAVTLTTLCIGLLLLL